MPLFLLLLLLSPLPVLAQGTVPPISERDVVIKIENATVLCWIPKDSKLKTQLLCWFNSGDNPPKVKELRNAVKRGESVILKRGGRVNI